MCCVLFVGVLGAFFLGNHLFLCDRSASDIPQFKLFGRAVRIVHTPAWDEKAALLRVSLKLSTIAGPDPPPALTRIDETKPLIDHILRNARPTKSNTRRRIRMTVV